MKRFIVNTGEYVDLTSEEVAEHEALIKEAAAYEKSVDDANAVKKANKIAGQEKLKKLGLSEEEVLALTS